MYIVYNIINKRRSESHEKIPSSSRIFLTEWLFNNEAEQKKNEEEKWQNYHKT
jgi:hypothetical protein